VEWEDVRLELLGESGSPLPWKVYGKVTRILAGSEGRLQATIRFTSVAPEVYQIIHRVLDGAAANIK
jgi:hypothetical protein